MTTYYMNHWTIRKQYQSQCRFILEHRLRFEADLNANYLFLIHPPPPRCIISSLYVNLFFVCVNFFIVSAFVKMQLPNYEIYQIQFNLISFKLQVSYLLFQKEHSYLKDISKVIWNYLWYNYFWNFLHNPHMIHL